MNAPLPLRVAEFRAKYRRDELSPYYSGWLHFSFTSLVSLTLIGWGLLSLAGVGLLELAVVPATFLYANFFEYCIHRFPMHRNWRPLAILHERHSLQHHRFYTNEAMSYEGSSDIKMIMFPPAMLVIFTLSATPIWFLIRHFASSNTAWLFFITAVGYFLSYEWLHFAYHVPADSWVARLPFMGALRRHHTTHHDLKLMSHHNFNVTFPICDRLFGSVYKGAEVTLKAPSTAGAPLAQPAKN